MHDYLSDESLDAVENLSDFAGMLVFDQWTCNTDGRQVVFVPSPGGARFRALMIDNGFCFNAGEWNFPDSPRRGRYARPMVYRDVRGIEAFEPWLLRVETKVDFSALYSLVETIPAEWCAFDRDGLARVVDRLNGRRARIRELVAGAAEFLSMSFQDWSQARAAHHW